MTAAGAVVSFLVALGPQSPQAQAPPPTGLIVGRVVDAASGRPIAGAIVSLNGGLGSAPGPSAMSRQPRAMTNPSGQFVFRRLAKGSYWLNAQLPGYVDGAYGRRRPGGTFATIQLDDAQRVGDIVIPMWRHATVSGTVTDESGEPLIGVQVRAFRRLVIAGKRRVQPGPAASTDDRGMYRIVSMPPGDYLVAFVWRETSVPMATAELLRNPGSAGPKADQILNERFSLGGGFLGAPGSPSSMQIGGSSVDLSPGGATPPVADERAIFIYPTQFYPGVPSSARAAVLTLTSGQERQGIDFSLRPLKTFRVSGTLVGPDGPVANTAVHLAPNTEEPIADVETSATMTGGGGEFTLLGVPPGQYTLKVLRVPGPPAITTPNTSTMTQIQVGSSMIMTSNSDRNPFPPASDDPTLFADQPVAVGNADVTDQVVTVQRGPRVTGRLEFDGTRDRPNAAALTRMLITLDPVDATGPAGLLRNVETNRPDETGAFKTSGVAAGRYFIRAGGAPAGWTLRSVTSDGRDVSDTPLDLRTTDASVVITFTDRPTKLTGMARTSNGNADPEAVVVAFPADSSAWTEDGLSSRRLRGTHASRDGSYTFEGLPPGEYCVTAIHEDTNADWRDVRVLEDLARGAAQVRLSEGDARTQDVKTVKGGSQ